jgi:enediyne biosynthesis protein E3
MLLLKKLLFVSERETSFKKRGFNTDNCERAAHFENIGRYFLKGYHSALRLPNNQLLATQLADTADMFYRGFCYEGAAMARTLVDELFLINKTRFNNLNNDIQGSRHTYMLHVGAGWAFARLPGSIEKRICRYDILNRWLIIDGYGFHQAYFHTRKYVHDMKLPVQLKEPYSVNVFYQGVGRCLWFIECARPVNIAERIALFPERFHGDLWAGIGLACTYACGAGQKEVELLKQISGPYIAHLAQGAVFAAKARLRAGTTCVENEAACRIITSATIQEAANISDRCLQQIPAGLPSAQQYESWRKLIRNEFCKTKQHEPVFEKMAG